MDLAAEEVTGDILDEAAREGVASAAQAVVREAKKEELPALAANANLDDNNPFDKTKASTNNAAGDSAAVMDTAPPQYTTSGQQQVSAADFQVQLPVK